MSEMTRNYLEVLGCSPGDSPEEIKEAFKALAFQHHPDRNPHNARAEERFKEVVEAYSYLSGNQEAYQALQKSQKKTSVNIDDVQDIYEILFDIELAPAPVRARVLTADLEIKAKQAFLGGEATLQFERHDICDSCEGTGADKRAKRFTCTYCFGEGEVDSTSTPGGTRECPKCNGRGFLSSEACLTCRGRGVLKKKAKLQVSIPSKISPGSLLTIPEEGHEYERGKRGVLEVRVSLKPDTRFSFDGKDIICEITVGLADAALGGEITVPTLEGSRPVRIPPGTQSGQVVRLKGMGLGGDQFVRVWVKTPSVTSEKERKILKGFKTSSSGRPQGLWVRLKKWIW